MIHYFPTVIGKRSESFDSSNSGVRLIHSDTGYSSLAVSVFVWRWGCLFACAHEGRGLAVALIASISSYIVMVLSRLCSTVHRSTSPYPPTLTPTLMSLLTTSSASFQSILDAALDSYARQTGIDLTKHPSADKLQSCRSPEDIIQLLSERETAFKDYRDKYRNLIDRLCPVVKVVQSLSGVLGEAAGLVSSRH